MVELKERLSINPRPQNVQFRGRKVLKPPGFEIKTDGIYRDIKKTRQVKTR